MFSRMRVHVNYANVTATVALVFAMTGGAYAAKHYLITSTKQISPNVLKSLKAAGTPGKAGATGATGSQGPQGSKGENGKEGLRGEKGESGEEGPKGETGQNGSPWSAGGKLPKGATETGTWTASGYKKEVELFESVSFPIQLSEAIKADHVHYVGAEEITQKKTPQGCPGTVEKPTAEPGYLCVYEQFSFGMQTLPSSTTAFVGISAPEEGIPGVNGAEGAGRSGAKLNLSPSEEESGAWGDWAVTAP